MWSLERVTSCTSQHKAVFPSTEWLSSDVDDLLEENLVPSEQELVETKESMFRSFVKLEPLCVRWIVACLNVFILCSLTSRTEWTCLNFYLNSLIFACKMYGSADSPLCIHSANLESLQPASSTAPRFNAVSDLINGISGVTDACSVLYPKGICCSAGSRCICQRQEASNLTKCTWKYKFLWL